MKTVYVLQHKYFFPHGQTDEQLIGVYATHEDAKSTAEQYKKLPGFCEQPKNFYIKEFEIDKDKYAEKT